MLAMVFCKAALEPWPISIMAMTAPTAMITPKADRAERILLRRRAPSAVRNVGGHQRRQAPASRLGLGAVVERTAVAGRRRGRPAPASSGSSSRSCCSCFPPAAGALVAVDLAVHDADDPMGIGGHLGIVRHQHDGDPFGVELLEHPQDFHAGVRVEVAGRLVGQDQRGTVHQRSGRSPPVAAVRPTSATVRDRPDRPVPRGPRGSAANCRASAEEGRCTA